MRPVTDRGDTIYVFLWLRSLVAVCIGDSQYNLMLFIRHLYTICTCDYCNNNSQIGIIETFHAAGRPPPPTHTHRPVKPSCIQAFQYKRTARAVRQTDRQTDTFIEPICYRYLIETNIIKGKETLTKTLQSLTNTYWTHTNTNNERHTNKNHIEITHIHCIY